LTILWTSGANDFNALTPKIVKDGTPDQRAVLRTHFPRGATLRIDRPKYGALLGGRDADNAKNGTSGEHDYLRFLRFLSGRVGGNSEFRIPNSYLLLVRRHNPPCNQALVHGSKPAAEKAAEQVEELDGSVGVHGQHFFQQ